MSILCDPSEKFHSLVYALEKHTHVCTRRVAGARAPSPGSAQPPTETAQGPRRQNAEEPSVACSRDERLRSDENTRQATTRSGRTQPIQTREHVRVSPFLPNFRTSKIKPCCFRDVCMGVTTLKIKVPTVTKSQWWFSPWESSATGVILPPTKRYLTSVWRNI